MVVHNIATTTSRRLLSSTSTILQYSSSVLLPSSIVISHTDNNNSNSQSYFTTKTNNTTTKMTSSPFDNYPMNLSERSPILNIVPPNICQFKPNYQSVPLVNRIPCGSGGTSFILRFGLPDVNRPMDLTTCACLLASADLEDDTKDGELTEVIRPYTPISTNDQVGCFDLLIKDYGQEHGWMSNYLCNELQVGEMVKFKHIDFNVKIPAPFTYKKVGMIAGGTGITPMIQALHAILGDGPKEQQSATEEVTLLYGSRNSDDILGGEMLQHWANTHSNKFNYVDVLSNEPTESEYNGERGFIDKEKILKYLPPPSDDDVIIFICGPPIMYKLLCGPRDETEITGILGELGGYTSNQVYKF